jgi:hypothetical protein
MLTLVLLLGAFRRPAWMAGACALGVALLVATVAHSYGSRKLFGWLDRQDDESADHRNCCD